jgi:hypothetical protein
MKTIVPECADLNIDIGEPDSTLLDFSTISALYILAVIFMYPPVNYITLEV